MTRLQPHKPVSSPRYLRRPVEQRIRSRAIRHAELLAASTNGVVTVLAVQTPAGEPFDDYYEFGCAYIDSRGAIYNALPPRYWEPCMKEYRRGMPSYRLVEV